MVTRNAEGQWTSSPTDSVSTPYAAINGILNPLADAMSLMAAHVQKAFGADVTSFTLFHNPSGGFFKDGVETMRDKLGFTTAIAKQFAGVLEGVQASGKSVQWVAHSQGSVIFSEAVRYHNNHSGGSLGLNSVRYHGAASNQWVAGGILGRAQIGWKGVYGRGTDAVHNIIGFNSLNPYNWVRSLISVPRLFMGQNTSPHSLPSPAW